MKKLCCLVLASCMVLCLWGCKKIIEPKNFEFSGLQITLTNEFKEKDKGYLLLYTDEVKIAIVPSPISSLADMTLGEYAKLTAESLENLTEFETIAHDSYGSDAFVYEYSVETEGIEESKNILAVYKGAEYYYNVTFACVEENYETYRSQFIEWLKTVHVT